MNDTIVCKRETLPPFCKKQYSPRIRYPPRFCKILVPPGFARNTVPRFCKRIRYPGSARLRYPRFCKITVPLVLRDYGTPGGLRYLPHSLTTGWRLSPHERHDTAASYGYGAAAACGLTHACASRVVWRHLSRITVVELDDVTVASLRCESLTESFGQAAARASPARFS